MATTERWVTVEELLAAKQRLIDAMPGYKTPVAYSVARRDGDELVFAHINEVGGTHELPAVVLATVCGYRRGNVTVAMTHAEFADAIALLSPAEPCEAFDHPNLWSWRPLFDAARPDSEFLAIMIEDIYAPAASAEESALRARLHE